MLFLLGVLNERTKNTGGILLTSVHKGPYSMPQWEQEREISPSCSYWPKPSSSPEGLTGPVWSEEPAGAQASGT